MQRHQAEQAIAILNKMIAEGRTAETLNAAYALIESLERSLGREHEPCSVPAIREPITMRYAFMGRETHA